jgi:hypothetical protein
MNGATTIMTSPPPARDGQPQPHLGDQGPHAAGGADGEPRPVGLDDPRGYAAHHRYATPPPTRFEAALPDLRNRLVHALLEANRLQADEAWARRRRDPISPHVLLYLYAEPPAGVTPRCALRMATRLFFAGDEPQLPMLLYKFKDRVLEHLRNGVDPRGPELSNAVQDMSLEARYVGLAVSTLDAPAGTWDHVLRTALNDMDVPGRCYAVLIDGSRLQLDRGALDQFGEVRVLSTHPIRDHSGHGSRRWSPDRGRLSDERQQDDEARYTWAWLQRLHDIIADLHPVR